MNPLQRGWKIGTIRNVQLYLHISLVLLLFYVILIASIQFPAVAKQSGVDLTGVHGTPLVWGVIFAVSLLVSIVLHEFGHVLVAQSMGVKVRSITLMMLGGVSQMDRIPEGKYAEFKVSIAGPLVSFVIGGVLFLLRGLTGLADIALFSYWLGVVNITLGIFNLFPAFPTDGGRVLRSLLSARQGKLKGTRNAVKVSTVFAWFFGLIGILQFNFLLILIAFFIHAAARRELFTLEAQSLLKGVRAGEIGKRINAIPDSLSLEQVAHLMASSKFLVLPVKTETGELAVVSADQLKLVPRERWHEMTVANLIWESSQGVDVNETLDHVMEHGGLNATGGIPLVENGRPVGVLRNADITEWIELRSLESKEVPRDLAA